VFFFSSRRRHTRSKRDWSSDVCSSDLHLIKNAAMDLAVEAGVGAVVEKDTGLSRETSGAVNAKQLFTWKFSPTATFGETAAGLRSEERRVGKGCRCGWAGGR